MYAALGSVLGTGGKKSHERGEKKQKYGTKRKQIKR
jgi:hypothetical protein